MKPHSISGFIFNDSQGFPDGHFVTLKNIQDVRKEMDHFVIYTSICSYLLYFHTQRKFE